MRNESEKNKSWPIVSARERKKRGRRKKNQWWEWLGYWCCQNNKYLMKGIRYVQSSIVLYWFSPSISLRLLFVATIKIYFLAFCRCQFISIAHREVMCWQRMTKIYFPIDKIMKIVFHHKRIEKMLSHPLLNRLKYLSNLFLHFKKRVWLVTMMTLWIDGKQMFSKLLKV